MQGTLLANNFCCKLDAEENVVAFVAPTAALGISEVIDFEFNKVNVLVDSEIPCGLGCLEVSRYVEELL